MELQEEVWKYGNDGKDHVMWPPYRKGSWEGARDVAAIPKGSWERR